MNEQKSIMDYMPVPPVRMYVCLCSCMCVCVLFFHFFFFQIVTSQWMRMQAKIQVRDQFVYRIIGRVRFCSVKVRMCHWLTLQHQPNTTMSTDRFDRRLSRAAQYFNYSKNINYSQLIQINVMKNFICLFAF